MSSVIEVNGSAFGAEFASSVLPGFNGPRTAHQVEVDQEYLFDQHAPLRVLMYAWLREWTRPEHRHRKGVWFSGPAGTGKTSMVEQFFARLGVPLVRCTWNPKREAEEMVSSKTLEDGDLLPVDQAIALAARNGWPVLINELDQADPAELVSMNDIIEKGLITLPSGEVIKAQRGFMINAACNTGGFEDPSGLFPNTRMQSRAATRRFFPVEFELPSKDANIAFLSAQRPDVDLEMITATAEVATRINQAYLGTADGRRLSAPISRPELLDWLEMQGAMVELVSKGINVAEFTLNAAFGSSVTREDRKVLSEIVEDVFGGA